MFKRSFKDRVGKATKPAKRSFRDNSKLKLLEKLDSPLVRSPKLSSAIVTLEVGKDQRLFAAHEDVLCHSPFFLAACKGQFFEANGKRIALPDEEPQTFSCVLEYLYKGDYQPNLAYDKRRNAWSLGDTAQEPASPHNDRSGRVEHTVHHPRAGTVLRDTAVYCLAEKFGLEELKRIALRKQGLVTGIEVATILRSARYAYDNTPDSDSRLRAHYLALIIRSRKTFKRSGTMQMEMESGGKLFFDLFVAMCNHIDDIVEITSPKTI